MPTPATLASLPRPVAATHPAARLYSRARRNLLPRRERVVAVHGGWEHEHLLAVGARPVVTLWCPGDEPDRPADPLAAAAVARAETAYVVSERTLARLHPGLRAPALLSVVALPAWSRPDVLGAGARLVLVADGIEYAGNLGTLLRTADAAGADGVLLTSATARLTHPKVFQASRGTVLTLPLLEYDDVAAARRDLTAAGFTPYVADPAAAVDYLAVTHADRVAVVVGSEGEGVADGWRAPGLTRVSIPMRGHADSLNVAVSASVLLFDARARMRQS